MFTHSAIISCSDSLPGNMSAGHGVAHPLCAWRQSWGREFCREEREGSQRVSHMQHRGFSLTFPKKVVLRPRRHPFTASVRWLGWVTPSGSPECGHTWQTVSRQGGMERGQKGQGRGGQGRGGEGRGWSCGKWSSFKQEMLLHAPSSQQQCLNLPALEELSHPNSYGCDTLLHHKPHIKQAISSKMLTCGESDLTAMSL